MLYALKGCILEGGEGEQLLIAISRGWGGYLYTPCSVFWEVFGAILLLEAQGDI